MRETSFNDIGKRLPYQESDQYIDDLINKATEHAIGHHHDRSNKRLRMMIVSAAAVALLLIGIGVSVINQNDKAATTAMQASSPLDEFLNTLSTEEAAQLPYYEIEEIPEY